MVPSKRNSVVLQNVSATSATAVLNILATDLKQIPDTDILLWVQRGSV